MLQDSLGVQSQSVYSATTSLPYTQQSFLGCTTVLSVKTLLHSQGGFTEDTDWDTDSDSRGGNMTVLSDSEVIFSQRYSFFGGLNKHNHDVDKSK